MKEWSIMLEIEMSYPSVNKTFRIPINIVEELERIAGEHNTSVNKVVIQCLEYALENVQTDTDWQLQIACGAAVYDGSFFATSK